jgi:hypothetical protein
MDRRQTGRGRRTRRAPDRSQGLYQNRGMIMHDLLVFLIGYVFGASSTIAIFLRSTFVSNSRKR